MIKYRASFWFEPKIEAVELIKETEQSVFYAGYGDRETRESKVTSDHRWFDTFAPAKDFLVEKYQRKADSANKLLATAKALHA